MGERIKRCFTAFYRGELMRKNIAGQKVGAQLVSASDGAAFTGAVTVYVTIDAATQAIGSVGSGAATHEGNGYHTYNPSQAETNGTLIAFTFVGTGAVPATVQLVVAEEAADTTLSGLTSGPSTGGNWPNESFGRRVLVGSSTQREVAVTGSNHVAADVHEFQPDAIDSDAIATSAVTEIAGGVWSAASSAYSAATGTMGLVMYAFSQMLELVAGVWRWKATALSQAPSSTGGDATEAKQDQIISLIQGSEVLTVATPNVNGNLVLTQGDTYDGAAGGNAKATWTVSTDYRTGWAVRLTIRDKDDAVVYTNTGTVDSATSVSVAIVVPTVSPFTGCPGVWQGKYDVQLTKSGSIKTIAIGVVYVNEDQTR
jgi:hypothetical protein